MYTEIGRSHEETARVPLSTHRQLVFGSFSPAGFGLVKNTPALSLRVHGMEWVIQGSLSSALLCPCKGGSWCSAHPAGWHLWTLMSSGRALQALCAHSLPVEVHLCSAERSNELRGCSCSLYKCPVTCTFVPVSRLSGLSSTLVTSSSSALLF